MGGRVTNAYLWIVAAFLVGDFVLALIVARGLRSVDQRSTAIRDNPRVRGPRARHLADKRGGAEAQSGASPDMAGVADEDFAVNAELGRQVKW